MNNMTDVGNSSNSLTGIQEVQGEFSTLVDGVKLLKVRRGNRTYRRFYYVDDKKKVLRYSGSRKRSRAKTGEVALDLRNIKDIREGRLTDVLDKLKPSPPDNRCFSIITPAYMRDLDLLAPNAETRNAWVRGLKRMVANIKNPGETHNLRTLWIKECFERADTSGDGTLSMDEIENLLDLMNAGVSKKEARKMFHDSRVKNATDRRGNPALKLEGFIKFYDLITYRPEIDELFNRYSGEEETWSAEKLQEFLEKEQWEQVSIDECKKLIDSYEPSNENSDKHLLTVEGLKRFLLSQNEDIFRFSHRDIYQDMTQPMTYYYIASSHNTYLVEDQLKGPSSVEGYIRALLEGCRCVELDCWDGPNGQPIIYHGHTLTSKISFKDVIEVIDAYAFKASDYPVILSLENHCSVEQQTVMANIMKDIMGDKLYVTPVKDGQEFVPSPEELRHRIIVKGKKLPPPKPDTTVNGDDDGGDVSDEDEAAEMADTNEEVKKEVSSKKKKKIKLSKHLSDLVVLCKAVHFNSFEHSAQNHKCYEMSSLGETKAIGLAKSQGNPFVRHTQKHFVRTYPKGTRTDSSNYEPYDAWNTGCQIVALNYQTIYERPLQMYLGKFRDNGGCGYILKPDFLTDPDAKFDPNNQETFPNEPQKLTVKIISGQQLPKAEGDQNDIVDPFVKVRISGVPMDEQKSSTKHIKNNGLNPRWNSKFEFTVNVPELAVVCFEVWDHDTTSGDEFIGQYSLPCTSVQTGYRHIRLLSRYGDTIPMASLFVYIMKE